MTKRVALQGIRGSYSEAAALKLVGSDAKLLECSTFAEVFEALRNGVAELAVVPVANRIIGIIHETTETIKNGGFEIVAETTIEIDHVLTGTADSSCELINTVLSHPAALAQCSKFLSDGLRQIPVADTASAIRDVITAADPRKAAISSRRAAEIYGAKILRTNIADSRHNWTQFYLIRANR
jgi:prephenate dehydratase